MGSRLDLQDILIAAIPSGKVYFQPPASKMLSYPCIVFARDDIDVKKANDKTYNHTVGYLVTYIDQDPDLEIVDKLLQLPMCKYERQFKKDNLNHDIFKIYY